ncbi:MAG TPA: UDP binding domain-containing protein [Solirubrobacteraceae bacterium]|nr:UDP binding domain-containing protein [Solirubrobacteraceae bacterium]
MPEVAVIGLGRIGLPLAISFADRGLSVLGVDKDADRLQAVRDARMPFAEPGAQEALDRVHAAGSLSVSDRVADAALAEHIVITLGTPSFSHVEIDISDIRSALDDLLGHLHDGHTIVLRSTIAPGTTDFVAGYLAKHRDLRIGEDVFVAHAPERIAAGRFFEEIGTLPCIVGGVGEASGERVGALFEVFGAPIVQTTPVQAELAKIWTNILRYANFALPGLTAGSCLRKDFAFSEERSNAPGMLLAVSRVNESVPLFLVEGMKRRLGPLNGRKIAVLGLAFKGNTDDERDSLAYKLVRLLERELADVAVHDPRVATPTPPFEEAVADAAAVVVAANHDEFCGPDVLRALGELATEDALVIDPWNCFGAAQVFGYVGELSALADGRVTLP